MDNVGKYMDFDPALRPTRLSFPGSWMGMEGRRREFSKDSSWTRAHYRKGDYSSSFFRAEYMPAGSGMYFAMERENYAAYNKFRRAAYHMEGLFRRSRFFYSDTQLDMRIYLLDGSAGEREYYTRRRFGQTIIDGRSFGYISRWALSGGLLKYKRNNVDDALDGVAALSEYGLTYQLDMDKSIIKLNYNYYKWDHDKFSENYWQYETSVSYRGQGLALVMRGDGLHYKVDLGWDRDKYQLRGGVNIIEPVIDMQQVSNPYQKRRQVGFVAAGYGMRGDRAGLKVELRSEMLLGDGWAGFYSLQTGKVVHRKTARGIRNRLSWQGDAEIGAVELYLKGKGMLNNSYFDAFYDPFILMSSQGIRYDNWFFDANLWAEFELELEIKLNYSANNTYFSDEYLKYLQVLERGSGTVAYSLLNFRIKGRVKSLEWDYSMENVLQQQVYTALNTLPYGRYLEFGVTWYWMN